jgi:hypothetical protein
MYLYTLTPGFIPKDIITEFISAVWTERYSSSGDVQLVTPATADMMGKLAKGTFLGLRGTKEIMLLDTQSIEEGLLTVTGKSLLEFLLTQVIRTSFMWFTTTRCRFITLSLHCQFL